MAGEYMETTENIKRLLKKLNFDAVGDIHNVMTWRETKQGYHYWCDISLVLIRSSSYPK